MPNWTPSQDKAIHTFGKNLLVSAGAGSGKTTVLTRRVIEQIEAGTPVSDFLIVTFTKASASDLKDKIRKAISDLISSDPKNKTFRRQEALLSKARISTIHSFCLEQVRAHFGELGLSPKVRMADEQETDLIAKDCMETLIDEYYASADPDFLLLADTFSGVKEDGPLVETLWDLYTRLRAYHGYFEWLQNQANRTRADADGMENGLFSTNVGKDLQKYLKLWYTELAQATGALYVYVASASSEAKCLDAVGYWSERMQTLCAALEKGYDAFRAAATETGAVRPPNASYKGMSEEAKAHCRSELERIKKQHKKMYESFGSLSEPKLQKQTETVATVLEFLSTFFARFEDLFVSRKKEKGIMDFSDAEHYLLKLLEKDGVPTPLCKNLQDTFKEVCIDEYQDVSPLQDHIFTLLSNGNNRFMVGDVKQSIYRFRNAHPDIFLGYKEAYSKQTDNGECIFLRENFRSGQHVLAFTNRLFSKVTAGTQYEKEYAGEELVFAKNTSATQYPVTVALAAHDELARGDSVEREAAYIAEEILRLMQTGVCEDRDGMRPYRYGDFALLFRAVKGTTEPYEKALRERNIPYRVSKEVPFFQKPEILLALSVLKTVDDPTDDISLVASLRSPIWNFSSDELYTIRRKTGAGSFFYALSLYAAEDDALGAKCKAFADGLDELRERANGVPCYVFLWEIYVRTGLLRICNKAEKDGLLSFYEYARSFESNGFKGVSDFLAYVAEAQDKGVELQAADGDTDTESVLLTTIHKSKGLEYPTVFLCATHKKMFSNRQEPFRLLRNEGLSFKLRDYETLTEEEPLQSRLASLIERDAQLGEELRMLYVACTRAKEKLYITGCVYAKKLETRSFDPHAPGSYLDLILYATEGQSECFERIVIGDEETAVHQAQEEVKVTVTEPLLTEEVTSALTYVYPHSGGNVQSKVSVSELKKTLAGEVLTTEYKRSSVTRAPAFVCAGERSFAERSAERGIANHQFLQFCDFKNVETNGLDAEIEALRQKKLLSEEQVALLDKNALEAFFASDLYARMRVSPFLKREMRFSVRMDASRLGGEEGESVLLQGVIDCFFEENDGSLTVVDYKTDRVRSGALLRLRHEAQLECYRTAIEQMTHRRVQKTALWSFELNKEV